MAVNHDRGAVDGLEGMSQGQEPLINSKNPERARGRIPSAARGKTTLANTTN